MTAERNMAGQPTVGPEVANMAKRGLQERVSDFASGAHFLHDSPEGWIVVTGFQAMPGLDKRSTTVFK